MTKGPESEPRFRSGYATAKADLRKLLSKVPERKRLGVVLAWLHEGDENGNA